MSSSNPSQHPVAADHLDHVDPDPREDAGELHADISAADHQQGRGSERMERISSEVMVRSLPGKSGTTGDPRGDQYVTRRSTSSPTCTSPPLQHPATAV